jgi:AAA domain
MNFATTRRELIREREQEQRAESLSKIAEAMRKQGASERSIQTALKGFYEYFKLTDKVKSRKSDPSKPTEPDPTSNLKAEVLGVLLSDIVTQYVDWLWQCRIPLGKITILDGDPGMGKSLIAIHLAACVSTGKPMPDGTASKQGGVVLIAPEDGAGDTLKPRLEAAGGDPSHVLLLNTIETLDPKRIHIYERPFSLSQDLEILEGAIKRTQAVLVILDPLMAILGHNIDSSHDQDVREVFTPLAQLAERTNCAILIIRHLNKGTSDNILYRGAGSIGIIAAARIGLIVAHDPDDENKRILATTKNNLSKTASHLTYQVVENERGIPYIQWLGENQQPLRTLFGNANLSIQRQNILKVLKASTAPLGPKDIAERSELDYNTALRKLLRSMVEAHIIVSPARGLYTTPQHPCLTVNSNIFTDSAEEQ